MTGAETARDATVQPLQEGGRPDDAAGLLPDCAEIYLVGGAVRDQALGLPVHDRDWVVVGATPQLMLAHGFLPVGRDFPVFLHPHTHEEYALARTERKSGKGYQGFAVYASPDVTLEQDLARRDLTINAMAQRRLPDGRLQRVDPFDGQGDLGRRLLRHVTGAFAEDPLRVLRVARFAARFADFEVAGSTMTLMRQMVAAGMLADLAAERVWQELARGLMEQKPLRQFEVLADCGALTVLLPGLYGPAARQGLQALAEAAAGQAPLAVRYACLLHGLTPAGVQALSLELKVPVAVAEVASLLVQQAATMAQAAELTAGDCMALLVRCDALRRPGRFEAALWACACIAAAQGQPQPLLARQLLLQALAAAQATDHQAVSRQAMAEGLRGPQVGERVLAARTRAVAQRLAQHRAL